VFLLTPLNAPLRLNATSVITFDESHA
jgi:hypothetical protein